MADAHEAAGSKLRDVAWVINRDGFLPESADPVGPLVKAFYTALSKCHSAREFDIVLAMLRDLSIRLNNELEEGQAALVIATVLVNKMKGASAEVRACLKNDQLTLRKNLLTHSMTESVADGDFKRAIELCDEVIEITAGDEQAGMINARAELARRSSARKRKGFLILGAIGAVILIVLANSGNSSRPYNTPSYNSDYASSPTYDSVPEYSPSVPTFPSAPTGTYTPSPAPIPQPEVVQDREEMPTYATGQYYNRGKVRYCMRQAERLDHARGLSMDYQQNSRFNAAVSDYNLRCANFQYSMTDMTAVRSEIARDRMQLQQEGRDIVGPASSYGTNSYGGGNLGSYTPSATNNSTTNPYSEPLDGDFLDDVDDLDGDGYADEPGY